MAAWRTRLETTLLKALRALWKKDAHTGENGSTAEAAARRLLSQAEAEVAEWEADEARRGEIFQKLRQRVDKIKRESKERKETIRKMKREADRREMEILALRDKLVMTRRKHRWEVVYGAANVMRRGLAPLVPPDKATEARFHEFERYHSQVWSYPMRLGVLLQHDPRPMIREEFPKLAAPPEWPAISVVTPAFRHVEFLERTMLSVLGQDYPRLEYFVMDGGSTDGSVEIIKKHASKLSGWVSEPDSGPADAINKGLARSTGGIMTWLNSDDLWMPGMLSYVAAWFAAHPEVDVVYGHRIVVDEKDNQVGHWTLPRHDGEMLLWADYVPQETMFWRRRIWEKVGGHLDESFQFAFDWELLLRFQRAGARIVRLPYYMGCFRTHPSQKSTADAVTVGFPEMTRLRERELGSAFNENALGRLVVSYQRRAIRCDRLLRWGVRW